MTILRIVILTIAAWNPNARADAVPAFDCHESTWLPFRMTALDPPPSATAIRFPDGREYVVTGPSEQRQVRLDICERDDGTYRLGQVVFMLQDFGISSFLYFQPRADVEIQGLDRALLGNPSELRAIVSDADQAIAQLKGWRDGSREFLSFARGQLNGSGEFIPDPSTSLILVGGLELGDPFEGQGGCPFAFRREAAVFETGLARFDFDLCTKPGTRMAEFELKSITITRPGAKPQVLGATEIAAAATLTVTQHNWNDRLEVRTQDATWTLQADSLGQRTLLSFNDPSGAEPERQVAVACEHFLSCKP